MSASADCVKCKGAGVIPGSIRALDQPCSCRAPTVAPVETLEALRLVASLNADTAKGLQADNAALRVRVRELEGLLAQIARLATPADPHREDIGPIPLDAVYTLTLGITPKFSNRLRKIDGDSKHGLALRDAIAATASVITSARAAMDDSEDVEQRALDTLEALLFDVTSAIPD